jgi:hypothetical protein
MMSNRHRQARRYKETLKRIPVMGPLRDEFSMVLHTSLWCLDTHPTADAFNNLSRVFNVVGLALENDRRHQHEARLIAGGASALNQVMSKVDAGMKLAPHESAPIRVAINTMDGLLGRMNMSDLYLAMRSLDAMNDAAMEQAAC